MAVASIATWRPRDGKLAEFMANVTTAKKIHERLGGKVRVWQSQFGPQTMTLGYVLFTLALATAGAVLAALWPAVRASRLRPIEALAHV